MYLLEILIKLGHTVQDLKCTGEEMHLMRLKIETLYTPPPDPRKLHRQERHVKIVFSSNYLQGGGEGREREEWGGSGKVMVGMRNSPERNKSDLKTNAIGGDEKRGE